MNKRIIHVSPEEFADKYRSSYASVFKSMDSLVTFGDTGWPVFPLPRGIDMPDYCINGIQRVAESIEGLPFIATEVESHERHSETVLIDNLIFGLEALCSELHMGHLQFVLFGQSGGWGCIFVPEDGFGAISGTPDFIVPFLTHVGGEERLWTRFRDGVNKWPLRGPALELCQHFGWEDHGPRTWEDL